MTETTKAELIKFIKTWIELDNEIKDLSQQAKELKEKRKQITDSLVNVMKSNEIDCFDISDGKLLLSKTKVKSPINRDHLMNSLLKFYKNDEETAKQLSDYIYDSRQEKIKESIRRKIEK